MDILGLALALGAVGSLVGSAITLTVVSWLEVLRAQRRMREWERGRQ